MTAGIWTETIPVRSSDLTPHGPASVPALCVDLQEAAGHHADDLGVSLRRLQEEDQAWVLSHLHLELDRPPVRDETVTIETWPLGLEGLYATPRRTTFWRRPRPGGRRTRNAVPAGSATP